MPRPSMRRIPPRLREAGQVGSAFLFALLLVASREVTAQRPDTRLPERVRFSRLSSEQGLSSDLTWRLLQDHKGFLWIATGDGLNRYDGRAFKVFRPGGPGALSHHDIWALFEDHSGTLWVGTFGGGLNRYDATTQTFSPYLSDPEDPATLGDDHIRVLHESSSEPGVLWIGTFGSGLDRFDIDGERFTHFRHDPDDPGTLPSDVVTTIFEDRSGTIWVGTRGGLARLVRSSVGNSDAAAPGVSFERFLHDPLDPRSISAGSVSSLFEDSRGRFWVATSSGLNLMSRRAGTFDRIGRDQSDDSRRTTVQINGILEDADGRLWVGTEVQGLQRFDPTAKTHSVILNDPGDPNSLSNNNISSLYRTRDGVLWVATYGGGVSILRMDKFSTYRHRPNDPNSLAGDNVGPVVEDRDGALWVGADGLNRFDASGRVTRFQHDPRDAGSLSSNLITTVIEGGTSPNTLWAGTIDAGLNRLSGETGRVVRYRHQPRAPNSLSSDEIWVVHESLLQPGLLWIGTGEGLDLFDSKTGAFRRLEDVEVAYFVESIFESPAEPGVLWVGANGTGLYKLAYSIDDDPAHHLGNVTYNARLFRDHFENPTPQSPRGAMSITASSDGMLWMGTHNGLTRMDPRTETFRTYTESDGLPNRVIRGVVVDRQGFVWASSSEALSRLDPKTGVFRHFDDGDGLTGELRLGFRDGNGTLYFGGTAGLTVVRPETIRDNPKPPPVVFTDFLVFDTSVPIASADSSSAFTLPGAISEMDHLVLSYRESVFTLEFAALDFTMPSKNLYSFKMEGFDEEWHRAGTRGSATYTNLDPGDYVFRVRASNNDGVWNDEGATIQLTITPPWWRTWWAYLCYAAGLLGLMYTLRRYELNRQLLKREVEIKRMETERLSELNRYTSRFLANISHEFRTPLTLTFGPLDDAVAGRFASLEEARPHFQRARLNGRRLLRLINQLLDLSRFDAGEQTFHPRVHDLATFLRQAVASFASLAAAQRLELVTTIPDGLFPHVFDAEQLEKAVANLLSNAFKFTPPGGKISVSLERTDHGTARIEVADTGPGIAPEHLPRLFDRFYQVDGGLTRRREGSGIGLALVRELVELHGGTVEVASTVGFGTRFTIDLPPTEPEAAATPDPDPLPPARSSIEGLDTPAPAPQPPAYIDVSEDATTVLVVEDNTDMRAYIRAHLEGIATIVEAEDGAVGLALAQELVPDLVLSDVMMPELDGFELCLALKGDIRTSHIPVVLLTAKGDVEHRIQGYERGADAYLPKPFNAGELTVRVRTLIEDRRRLRAHFADPARAVGGGGRESDPPGLPALDDAFLKRVSEAVEAHLADPQFGVDRLAEELGMSTRQVQRKLRALIDETAGPFIRRMRLERATALLEEGSSSVKDIAHVTGFGSATTFGRAFREAYGVAPSAFAARDPAQSEE